MRDAKTVERVANLHPKARAIFEAFINDIEKEFNTIFRVVQGFRTFAEQQAIYDQPHDGKDNDGDGKVDEADERVTNAPAGKSFHNYGIAVDLVEMVAGVPNWNFKYSKLVPIAKKHGLEWGGSFVTIHDEPHFQITFGYTIQQLYKKFLNKDFIPNTQYVNL